MSLILVLSATTFVESRVVNQRFTTTAPMQSAGHIFKTSARSRHMYAGCQYYPFSGVEAPKIPAYIQVFMPPFFFGLDVPVDICMQDANTIPFPGLRLRKFLHTFRCSCHHFSSDSTFLPVDSWPPFSASCHTAPSQ